MVWGKLSRYSTLSRQRSRVVSASGVYIPARVSRHFSAYTCFKVDFVSPQCVLFDPLVFTRFSFLSYLFYLRSTEFYFVSWTWNPKRLEFMLWRLLAVFFSTVQPSKWINKLPYSSQFNLGNIDLNEDMFVAVVIAIQAIANKPEKQFWDFNAIRTHGLCVSAIVLYHQTELWRFIHWEQANLLSSKQEYDVNCGNTKLNEQRENALIIKFKFHFNVNFDSSHHLHVSWKYCYRIRLLLYTVFPFQW